ncbi:DUF3515 domain-containing protein [Amycolatopsis arida]|uniref:DUF3515 domain-containing protein n=1 Tax=Amycolatopsis arida TaxID=587909 RepID=UPI000B81D251|nr:DUF3515 domain-containing protein [Amycolatopsis arida]
MLIVVAAVLAVALAVGVAVLGLLTGGTEDPVAGDPGPLPLVPVPAPQAAAPECGELIQALPEQLTSAGTPLDRRTLAEPAPPATVAWGRNDPVVLRCGLARPPELVPNATLREINGVRWLQVPGEGAATWYVVDREVYVALTVPEGAGTGPLQQVSDAVTATLLPVPVRTG